MKQLMQRDAMLAPGQNIPTQRRKCKRPRWNAATQPRRAGGPKYMHKRRRHTARHIHTISATAHKLQLTTTATDVTQKNTQPTRARLKGATVRSAPRLTADTSQYHRGRGRSRARQNRWAGYNSTPPRSQEAVSKGTATASGSTSAAAPSRPEATHIGQIHKIPTT